MLKDRRSTQPIQWALVLAVLSQILAMAYTYGKLSEQVDDLQQRLIRIERRVDEQTRASSILPTIVGGTSSTSVVGKGAVGWQGRTWVPLDATPATGKGAHVP